ncbi:MAG TPA: hypothetical protein VLY85_01765, partial [Thermoplasmata archaeon]|nr:hypothetical protein [Thermoplasmata archaeon]
GGANENWSVQVHPASAIETNQIDVATSGGSNTPEIIASSTNWTVGSTSPSGPSTSSSAAPPTAGGTVQGQPEPLPYAQATSRCLVGICPSSSAGPASAGAGPPTAAYLAGGAAAGVGAGAAAVWLARRPRPPSAGRGEGLPPGAPEHAVPFPPDR